MAPGYAVAVMGIDFTLRYFYKVLLDLLPICNQDKGNKIRWEEDDWPNSVTQFLMQIIDSFVPPSFFGGGYISVSLSKN